MNHEQIDKPIVIEDSADIESWVNIYTSNLNNSIVHIQATFSQIIEPLIFITLKTPAKMCT